MNAVQQANIPRFLVEQARWCCWRYEAIEGKKRKIPYTPSTGQRAKVNDPDSFGTFEEAVSAMFRYEGIGVSVNGDFYGVDLDHCIEEGKLLPWAQDIVDRFQNTYCEISPSGMGIRIFGILPENLAYNRKTYHIKRGDVEVYIPGFTNRFLTITGNTLNGQVLSQAEDSLYWLLETFMRKPEPELSAPMAVAVQSYLSDEQIIAKASAAQNGEKFSRLWSGDITGFSSHSEADLAFCSLLAFWCGGDREQMDRLFRQSGLMRDKWDEYRGVDTYGNSTLARAVSGVKEFYKPVAYATAIEDFSIEQLRDLNPANRNQYPWDDIGAGHLFADYYKDTLRYVPERKSWFYYHGGVWQQDTGSLVAMKNCMILARLLYGIAADIQDEDRRKAYIKYIGRWQSHSNRVNILKDAQVYHPISYGSFDSDIYTFNCRNGTLHMDTGEFAEHRSSDLLTKMSPVSYDPSAYSDRFATYINEIMSGDWERAKFLQKMMGYGLTGDTRYECLTILYGATTRNGKGTLCESILKVLGDYGCASRPETIALKNNANGSSPSEDVARLAGVRFVNIPEPGKGMVMDAAKVKTMTGNDTINARFLHENSFDFRPQFKIYINTNYLPVVNDSTLFSSDRIIIVPFEQHFDENNRDSTLKQQFATEEVQSAILNWLLEGHRLLRKEGLSIPASVKEAIARYQHESDKMALFMEDCLEMVENEEVLTSAAYSAYKNWCQQNGYFPEGMKNFKQGLLATAKVVRKRPKHGGEKTTVVLGYRLRSDFDEPLLA